MVSPIWSPHPGSPGVWRAQSGLHPDTLPDPGACSQLVTALSRPWGRRWLPPGLQQFSREGPLGVTGQRGAAARALKETRAGLVAATAVYRSLSLWDGAVPLMCPPVTCSPVQRVSEHPACFPAGPSGCLFRISYSCVLAVVCTANTCSRAWASHRRLHLPSGRSYRDSAAGGGEGLETPPVLPPPCLNQQPSPQYTHLKIVKSDK